MDSSQLKANWKKIISGVYSTITFKNRRLAKERQEICKQCPFYDEFGEGDNVVIKGKPACGICGCNIKILTNCKECSCSLEENPKW